MGSPFEKFYIEFLTTQSCRNDAVTVKWGVTSSFFRSFHTKMICTVFGLLFEKNDFLIHARTVWR